MKLEGKSFFEEYPKFYDTSKTGANSRRLAFRYHLIVEQNVPLLDGKRIVEVASHDGRWAFAALKAGALFVHGIEPRQALVDNANATFAHYGIAPSSYKFVCGDGYDELENLKRAGEKFDTAMVLGFLYHTARQYEIIHHLSALGCSAIIIDTNVIRNVKKPVIRLKMENTKRQGNIFSHGKDLDLIGLPSLTAVHWMLTAAGYRPRTIAATVPPAEQVGGYRSGRRFTIVGVRGAAVANSPA